MAEPGRDLETTPDLTNQTVGDFVVLRKLGQGAMGQVYLARQQSLKREVALKFLRRDLADSVTALKRFQAEAETVARITHANIVQVYAVGEFEGLRYMALEFVDGRNLREYLARKGPPDLPIALSILRQIASALQRASEIGLVHRDIKPENILVTRKVEVKVADFGLSRYFAGETQPLNITQSGMTLGTPLYMSPEQVQGKSIDHRSDIYSFGITAFHLLVGQPPFTGATPFDVALKHVQEAAPHLQTLRPDLPAGLCDIVQRMMAKQPEARYQTARDIIRDLAKVQKGLPIPAVELSVSQPLSLNTSTSTNTMRPLSTQMNTVGSAMSPIVPTAATTSPGTWAIRLLAVALLIPIGFGGWWLYDQTHRPTEAKPIVGLPDVRPPSLIVSQRERELSAKIKERSLSAKDFMEASTELGLLYVRDRRLDDAERVFKALEQDRPGPVPKIQGPPLPQLVSKFGLGIVLAYRDKAADSNAMIVTAQNLGGRIAQNTLDDFLMRHPDFSEALANALHRNAQNLSLDKLPSNLEWLRTPAGISRGPKS
ncbi:MAG: serine/threonine-protein kinase [Fimbriiglobus sp.]